MKKLSAIKGVREMRISVVGLEHVGSLGWYIKQALLKMGHQVELFDYRKVAYGCFYFSFFKNSMLRRIALKILQKEAIKRMNIKLINSIKSFKPDVIIVQKGEIIYPETIREIKKISKAKMVVWHADSPFSVLTSSSNIIGSFQEYDVCFVFDPYYILEMIRAGAKQAEYLPFGCDSEVHRTISLTMEEKLKYGSDVVFIGNCQKTNQRRTEIVRSLTDFNLKIWGGSWKSAGDAKLSKCIMSNSVYGEEMVKILNASKIAINIHHGQSITGVNMRTFETPACGCLLITDELPELTNFFECSEEVVCYKDISDLRKKIIYYLKCFNEREMIAKKGQNKAHSEHTYVNRMEKLIKITLGK